MVHPAPPERQREPDEPNGDNHDRGRYDRGSAAEQVERYQQDRAGHRERKHRQARDHKAVSGVDDVSLFTETEVEPVNERRRDQQNRRQ